MEMEIMRSTSAYEVVPFCLSFSHTIKLKCPKPRFFSAVRFRAFFRPPVPSNDAMYPHSTILEATNNSFFRSDTSGCLEDGVEAERNFRFLVKMFVICCCLESDLDESFGTLFKDAGNVCDGDGDGDGGGVS